MERNRVLLTKFLVLCFFVIILPNTSRASYNFYQLTETTPSWDGTDADRLKVTTADYDYTYGDEESLTYSLPWQIVFYGQKYSQITVDTNGNIWFGTTGSANSFTLANTGKGPVAASWNNDLTSRVYGGVFIQHKTNPERVVIEWQTETYTDESNSRINDFEAVLFPSSDIRFDYKTFNPAYGKDFGSGISKSNNLNYLNLTTVYGNAFTLAGRSFSFTTIPPALNVTFSGTGNGAVTSTPSGLACSANCSATFPVGTDVTLHPTKSQYSLFNGWTSGPCSGTGDCVTTLFNDISVNAAFNIDTAHQTRIDGTTTSYFTTIQDAYNAAADGSAIKLWALTYNESLSCDRPVEITFKGGYNESYTSIIDEVILNGTVTVSDGTVIVDGLSIR